MKKYLAIDIGGTNIKYALIDEEGHMGVSRKCPTPSKNLQDFLAVIHQIVSEFVNQVDGVAFSAPGKIDTHESVIYYGGALPFLHELNLKQEIEERYGVPVAVQNDAKAAALAEMWKGSLQNISNAAVIVLGTGVGGGIILDGKLRLGPHFQAGELSLSVLDASNSSDHRKWVGSLCSAVDMVSKVNQAIGNSEITDGQAAFQAILAQDERVMDIFQTYCRHIAYLILNIQSFFDLTSYAIGGGISQQPILLEEIKRQFHHFIDTSPILKMNVPEIDIFPAAYRNDANLYGAVYALIEQH